MHVMSCLHEENTLEKFKVLLELAVSLDLTQEDSTGDALTLKQFSDQSFVDILEH